MDLPNASQLPRTTEIQATDVIHIIQDGVDKGITAEDFQQYGSVGGPHTHVIADITGLQTALDGKVNEADLADLIEENSPDASYTEKGIARFGTSEEVAAGTLEDVIVNPLTLKLTLDERFEDFSTDLAGIDLSQLRLERWLGL